MIELKLSDIKKIFVKVKQKPNIVQKHELLNKNSSVVNPILENFQAYYKPVDLYPVYKNLCIEALNKKNPQERTFILDPLNKVVVDFIGDSDKCLIKIPDVDDLKILHGHRQLENGLTLPISFQDFHILNKYDNINEIIAVDSKGNESLLSKGIDYDKLSKRKMKKLEDDYKKYILKAVSLENRKKIEELAEYCASHKNSDAVLLQIAELLNNTQFTSKGADAINQFWQDNAHKVGLIYKPYL